ncbi:family 10 glycosylhydrolase [Paenibacillus tarimensis]|uniref:family 10 glycosylhydrolase n=1 Tax=Paenibacillus tarimensis TaxID=416012 RepID=UPI001F3B5694|nr:family 10 glycosylhydrolase [Paenibacillus tarimensis]MCF2943849.1 family 10 glycosylhydrolase [Paenibacillus tarimensis]
MAFRKWVSWLLLVSLMLPLLKTTVEAADARSISLYLEGEQLTTDVPPFIIPKVNVTMVPLRVISEGLGASVAWVQAARTVTITRDDTVIRMTGNQAEAYVNDSPVPLDASVQMVKGRTMVPIRFVSEQLGLKVVWNQVEQTIRLSARDASPAVPAPVPIPAPVPQIPDSAAEMRGVWISTVYNLDWPTAASYGKPEMQKQEYVKLLDELQSAGINTVFVQVRPSADSFYPSKLVPWSRYAAGAQGKDPGYDPLAFLIDETHRRGMAFHAWFNPFRASPDAKLENLASGHVSKKYPQWIVNSGGKLYINPGVPEARQHIIDVVTEVVQQYDVDGIHLDDYFYPSSGKFSDDLTYRAYNPAKLATVAEWRRDNINSFIRDLGSAIKQVNPEVEFGVSPFGVWRNAAVDPTGSNTKAGVTAYDSMYADVRTWIRQGWVDYIMPQLYWSMTNTAVRYDTLADWWAREVGGTGVDLYIGHSPYKLGTPEVGWQSPQEIINQLVYNKKHPEIKGDVFFSAKDLRRNPLGILDALRLYYR